MTDSNHANQSPSGPFGMGWQGYAVIAIIIAVTAVFASTRSHWGSLVLAAIIPPLIMFPLLSLLTHRRQDNPPMRRASGGDTDLLAFFARTNPIMFLLFGSLARRSDENRYQEMLHQGPYGMGQAGYLFLVVILLAPVAIAVLIMVLAGHLPMHNGPHIP